jgi:hypothetical protein
MGALCTVVLSTTAYARAADGSLVVPYEANTVSSVNVNTLKPFPLTANSSHITTCKPTTSPGSDEVMASLDGILAFYVLFHGGVHHQTILCTNSHESQRIEIEYDPGQVDQNKVQLRQSEAPLPAQCNGLWAPVVTMLSPADSARDVRRFDLFYAVSDPQRALQQTIRFRHGADTIEGHPTLFEIFGGLQNPPPGFKVTNAMADRPVAADTTYTVEVRFKPSWTAPDICTKWFAVGTFTTSHSLSPP